MHSIQSCIFVLSESMEKIADKFRKNQCCVVRFVIMICIIEIFMLPCILYNSGVARQFNRFASDSKCIIVDTFLTQVPTTYLCNCVKKCYVQYGTSCRQECDVCPGHYDVGHLVLLPLELNFTTQNNVHNMTESEYISIYGREISIGRVDGNDFNNRFKIDDIINCYYLSSTGEIQVTKTENQDYFRSFIAFTIIAGLILIIWIIGEIRGDCCEEYVLNEIYGK